MVEPLSIYLHIPFCSRKCGYCHFFVVRDEPRLKAELLACLKREISLKAPLFQNRPIVSIYFGGGTPSLLAPEAIGELISLFPGRTASCEITLEANPDSCDGEKLRELHSAGINRLSFGVQAFDDELLSLLTRRHTSEEAQRAVEAAYASGFTNISIDLMTDVPTQRLHHFTKSLQIATSLPISHLSLYNLTFEPDTPFFRRKERLQELVAKEEESLALLETAFAHLKAAGFERYEISAFMRHKRPSAHNLGYWQGREFLGFGPSAHSFWQGQRYANPSSLKSYFEKSSHESELAGLDALSKPARNKELLAVRLRVFEPFPLRDYLVDEKSERSLMKLADLGWIHLEEGLCHLTERGALFYDSVAEELIEA